MNKPRALYIHIPFCLSKCRYCDFASAPHSEDVRAAYLSALESEILSLPQGELDTLYFGGGTPSLLTPGELERLLSAVSRRFHFSENAEISLETNPKTASEERLRAYRSLGVNRLSIGMQSLSDRELLLLGRAHSSRDFFSTYEWARKADFPSVSADMMYGIPAQTKESLFSTLTQLLSLSPDHISAYGLILEEGTPLWRDRAEISFPSEDEEFRMYEVIVSKLREAGFLHYEVSNYAKPGHECRHNLTYWRQEEYYAAGLAASSFIGGVRRTAVSDMKAYLAAPGKAFSEETEIRDKDAEFEYIMLRLRLSEGIELSDFEARFGFRFESAYRSAIAPYLERGYLLNQGGRLALTDEGLYLSSALLTDLCPD